MKLHPPLHRDQTATTIGSRDLSDPQAYSMIYSPLSTPTPNPRPGILLNETWPLRPSAVMQPSNDSRQPRSFSLGPGRRNSNIDSSKSRSIPVRRRSSSANTSKNRVNSTSPSGNSSKSGSLEKGPFVPPPNSPTLSRPQYLSNDNVYITPELEGQPPFQDVTALPTIQSKPGPFKMVFGAIGRLIRNLQEVPPQPCKVEKGSDGEKPVVVFTPGKGVYMAFATLANLTVMVALDSTALSVALPVIANKLNGSALEAFWAAASYLLTSTVFQPTIGQISDVFGRKIVTIVASVLFLIGIFISGMANNFTVLLTGRTVQGIGGGGIVVLTQLIICDLIPLRLRGQWFGVISSMYAIGTVSGPLLGGVFSEKVTWRWIFWINLPFVIISLIMIPLFIRLGVAKNTFMKKLQSLDWIGSALFVASATSFLIPLSWGGVMYNWDSWRTLVPLLVGAAGLVGLYFYEGHWAKNPMIKVEIFKNRNAAVAYLGVVLHGTIVTGSLYYLPLYYEAVKGLSPILSGIALFPESFTIAPGAFVVGALIARTNAYRWAVWAGWAITTLGLGLLWLLDSNTSTPQWIFLNLVVGIGIGFNYVALGVMLQASTKDENMTSAVALFTFGRLLGQALGVVIGGVTFENQLRKKLLAEPTLAGFAAQYANNGAALAELIGTSQPSITKTTLQNTYADSLKAVWMSFAALSGVALISSVVIKGVSLDREFDPSQQLGTESDTTPLAPSPEGEKVNWQLPEGQESGVSDASRLQAASRAAHSWRASKRDSRWYGAPGTAGSRPLNGARSVRNRNSSRYSREIGGFYSFPRSLGKAHVYEPVLGHRPTSIFLPSVAHQVSLENLLEDDFDKLMREAGD